MEEASIAQRHSELKIEFLDIVNNRRDLRRILRCGVAAYGDSFLSSAILKDNAGRVIVDDES